jgi:hypothetical protein
MWRLSSKVVRPGKSGLVFNQSCNEKSGEQLLDNKTGFCFREKIRDEIGIRQFKELGKTAGRNLERCPPRLWRGAAKDYSSTV